MTGSLVDAIAAMLQALPGRPFTAREIALRLIAADPAKYRMKLADSTFLRTHAQLVNQLVSEIGARKASLLKKYPAVVIADGKPLTYAWSDARQPSTCSGDAAEPAGVADLRRTARPSGAGDEREDPLAAEFSGIRTVLAAVHELHRQGFQKVRICPGLSSSGGYYRIYVSVAENVSPADGIMFVREESALAHTSGTRGAPFGWRELVAAAPAELARRMLTERPELGVRGRGRDWAYAGWFVEMLGHVAKGRLPCAFQAGEWSGGMRLLFDGPDDTLPLPPAPPPSEEAMAAETGALPPAAADAAAQAIDPETVPLGSFDLSQDSQRVAALVCFYHQWEQALLPFTAIVWDRLSTPKAARAEGMAAILKLGGKGKTALRRVLSAYLKETDNALAEFVAKAPEIGDRVDARWWRDARSHFERMDRIIEAYARRWSRILNGAYPNDGRSRRGNTRRGGTIVRGPWRPLAE